jgi:4-amino-4-deoxy-L-arabinose transferase
VSEVTQISRSRYFNLERQLATGLLTVILIASFALKLHHLGHLALRPLDESFHAIVAANLLEHPFTPTLIDRPYLPYDYRDWQNNHVWLHKPIVPLWQIALSYLIFGIDTLALRLPSAILSTLAVLLTYLIGRQLLDRTAALVAAALQAFSPAILMLVHGYAFSDHIDVALLFWVELGIWFTVRAMRSGASPDAILAGVAQGLGILSKMYPALIVTGIALAAWVVPMIRLGKREPPRFGGRHLAWLLSATLLTAAPWMISIAIRFPDEFRHEYLRALLHLTHDVEDWAAPWDRLLFGYALAAFYVFYPGVLVAMILSIARAWGERDTRLWIVIAWALGVFVPFTLATSKTPSATAIGWPAMFLLLGAMISRASRGDAWMLGAWITATALAIVARGTIDPKGMGGESGVVMRQHLWIPWHVLGALAGSAGIALLASRIRSRALTISLIAVAGIGSLWLFGMWVERAWRATQIDDDQPAFVEVGRFAQSRLPPQAVLLLEEREKLERNTLMFRARRTTYPLTEDWRDMATVIVASGGVPLIVSHRDWPLRAIHTSRDEDRTVYQLTPADLDLPTTTPR